MLIDTQGSVALSGEMYDADEHGEKFRHRRRLFSGPMDSCNPEIDPIPCSVVHMDSYQHTCDSSNADGCGQADPDQQAARRRARRRAAMRRD